MLSGVFIFSVKGEVLISRLYRSDIKRSIADYFRIQIISSTEIRSPITTIGTTSFFHIKSENLFIVAVSKRNLNAALVFEFLNKLVLLAKSYFAGKFDEESVKNNFTLVYELLDEVCDFGYPQNTESESLKLYITTQGLKNEKSLSTSAQQQKITMQATGAVSWRKQDIKYRKNEAFIDIIESVNLILSSKGTILGSDVSGQVLMRAYLSGMPECKFGLNDKLIDKETLKSKTSTKTTSTPLVELDDCHFHQCVKLTNLESSKTITFIPPDGEFELMKYRSTDSINLPFKVHAVVNETPNLVEYKVIIKSLYPAKNYAQNIVCKIPTPTNTSSSNVVCTSGKAKYVGSENSVVWKIPRMQGQQEILLSCDVELTVLTNKVIWSRPPITMDFQVLMFTSSGLLVKFLKIYEKTNYTSVKWVRYMTKAGNYQIRI